MEQLKCLCSHKKMSVFALPFNTEDFKFTCHNIKNVPTATVSSFLAESPSEDVWRSVRMRGVVSGTCAVRARTPPAERGVRVLARLRPGLQGTAAASPRKVKAAFWLPPLPRPAPAHSNSFAWWPRI